MSGSARDFYEGIAGRYDRVYSANGPDARAKLAKVVARLPARARVLVLGVGTGRELSTLVEAGHAPVGIDFSPRMLDRAGRRGHPVPLVLGDFWQPLPFPAGTFDACVALHGTLSHAAREEDITHLGEELARVLAPRGVFVLEAPSPTWVRALPRDAALEDDDGRVTRVLDDGRVSTLDRAAEVSVECLTIDAPTWEALLTPWFELETRDDGHEIRVVATARDRSAP